MARKLRNSRRSYDSSYRSRSESNFFSNLIALVFLIAVGYFLYAKYFGTKSSDTHQFNYSAAESHPLEYSTPESQRVSSFDEEPGYPFADEFSCDGKVYCSEMSSCDEAKFYLRNCLGVKIDGDGDGVPCESQWCSW